jgi:hypothetical protein
MDILQYEDYVRPMLTVTVARQQFYILKIFGKSQIYIHLLISMGKYSITIIICVIQT